MDLKDHKNIQTEWTQDAQSLFSPSHLLPACNHRHRVTLLARIGTPRSHFSQGKKTTPLVKCDLQAKRGELWRLREAGWPHWCHAGFNLRWRVFVQDACVCRSARRLQQEILLHSSYPRPWPPPAWSILREASEQRAAGPGDDREDASEAGGEVKRKGCRAG